MLLYPLAIANRRLGGLLTVPVYRTAFIPGLHRPFPHEQDPASFLKRNGRDNARLFFPRPQEILGMSGKFPNRLFLGSKVRHERMAGDARGRPSISSYVFEHLIPAKVLRSSSSGF